MSTDRKFRGVAMLPDLDQLMRMHKATVDDMTHTMFIGDMPDPEQIPTALYGVPLIAVKLPFMKGHVVKLKNNQTFADWFEQNYRRQE